MVTIIITILLLLYLILDYKSAKDIKDILMLQNLRINWLKRRVETLEKKLEEHCKEDELI